MGQRWRARWVDEQGRQRELIFESPGGLGIARIDFHLLLIDQHISRPAVYQLEKIAQIPLKERNTPSDGSNL